MNRKINERHNSFGMHGDGTVASLLEDFTAGSILWGSFPFMCGYSPLSSQSLKTYFANLMGTLNCVSGQSVSVR